MRTALNVQGKGGRGLFVVGGGVWVALLLVGFSILGREEFTPVRSAPSVTIFPHDSAIQRARDQPTLLFFAHPQCPCTRASLHELDRLLAETQNKVSVVVVFTLPKGVPAGWEDGDLWQSAATMPGVRVFRDEGGRGANRFGVKGSGHVLLYDLSGALLFSGGITSSRGHEGDNPGRAAVISFILSGHALVSRTPVFGCSLL